MSSQLDYEINKELGECYLFMGELDRAEDYYKKAVGSNGVHPEPYLGLATIAVQRGDLEKALTLYQKASEIEETDKSLTGMGLIEMEQGEYEQSFDHLSRALNKNPENLVTLFAFVQVGHQLGRLQEIVDPMHAYLEICPDNPDVRYSLAGCLVSLGRKDEARKHLETILEQDPAHSSAEELLGQL
ncbi:MAG: tetratricopeptide repeat protein [Desulfovibrionales bacterium]